ncbi:MAG: multiprotein-bridging factor 1 family protein [Nitrososphaerota archaeon]|nr:multiprotein-bridging factor 1 family protein [Nitrososphaerota archaeon]
MICEICGGRAPRLRKAVVEGSIVNICPDCFNTITRKVIIEKESWEAIAKTPPKKKVLKPVSKVVERKVDETAGTLEMESMELVDGYRDLIKKRMRELGWNDEVLGARTGLKASLIRKIEAGKIVPSIPDVRKIEDALKVKLLRPSSTIQERVSTKHVPKQLSGVTLGDVIREEFLDEE